MQVDKVLKEIMVRENLSYAEISKRIGKEAQYVSAMLRKNRMKVETIEAILDACGYDLSIKAICRADGFEFDMDLY